MSASVSSQVRQESLAAGCDDFLAKPIRINELLDRLRRHLGLEWIYKDSAGIEAEQQQAPPLVIPPQDVLLNLLECAKGRYIIDIRKSLTRLKDSDPKFVLFATRIEQLANNFQFEQIIDLIKAFIAT